MQKIQVLLADDNREFTHLLSEFIGEQEDMEIMGVAYNGNEVLRFLEQQRELPDVLILDIIMPHLDGLGVLEKMREMNLPSQPKIIMLTAFGQENITQKAVQLGASYYILKPFDMETLTNRIRQLAGNSSSTTTTSSTPRANVVHMPKGKIWMPISRVLFMKSVYLRILKAINIYVKPLRWFTTILKS